MSVCACMCVHFYAWLIRNRSIWGTVCISGFSVFLFFPVCYSSEVCGCVLRSGFSWLRHYVWSCCHDLYFSHLQQPSAACTLNIQRREEGFIYRYHDMRLCIVSRSWREVSSFPGFKGRNTVKKCHFLHVPDCCHHYIHITDDYLSKMYQYSSLQ